MQGENGKEMELLRVLSDRGIDSIEDLDRLFEPSQYAIIPIQIMERGDLTANAKILYAEISSLTKSSGYCFATDKYIGDRLGISPRSIQRPMQELADKKIIKRDTLKNKRGTFRRIFLTWDGVGGRAVARDRVALDSVTTTKKGRVRQRGGVALGNVTKGEVDKERSTRIPLIAKSPKKAKPATEIVVPPEKAPPEPFIEIMDIFRKGINPTLNFGHKTHRKSAQDLVTQLGAKDAIFAAEYAVSVQGKPYAPTITTPYALFSKLGDLRAYYRRHHGKDGNGSVAVI